MAVLRTSPSRFGLVLALIPIGKAIWWLVELAGDITFVAENREGAMDIIGAPWFSGAFAVAAIALIVWGSRKGKKVSSSESPEPTRPSAGRPTAIRVRGDISGLTVEDNYVSGDLDFVVAEGKLEDSKFSRNVHDAPTHTTAQYYDTGAVFHPRRREYSWFKEQVESASEVWAFWHVGTSARNNGLLRTAKITRLLLIFHDPKENAGLADATGIDADTLGSEIRRTSAEARRLGIQVKFWNGYIAPPFTIGNPLQAKHTWVIAEHLVPYMGAANRPANYITHVDVCERYRNAFQDMWANDSLTNATYGLDG